MESFYFFTFCVETIFFKTQFLDTLSTFVRVEKDHSGEFYIQYNAYYREQKMLSIARVDWLISVNMNVQEKLILTVINYVRKYIERKLDFQER